MTRKLGCMIDVRRLRVLREVAEHGTLAAAADALHLTPSAVSQQLAALEREVGQPVLERNGRGVRLTGAAEVLVGHANLVLAQLEAAEADVAAYAGGVVGTVRVVGFATGLAELVAPAAAALRASHPRLALVVVEQEAPDCFASLARGDADIAISMSSRQAPPSDDRRFRRRPLISDTLDAVLPEGHPLAATDVVALSDLAVEPFVGPPDGTQCHDVTIAGCAAAGFTPAIEHRTLDFHTAMALVAAGLGVALVPRLGQAVVPPGAVVRPLRDPAPARHVFAATRAAAERRPTVAAVLDALAPADPGPL
jgi:DNA-binding transcriptional LysR family regulator